MADIDVAILVVNWNTRDLLAQCLEAVCAQACTVGVQVVVVDQASSDGSAALVRERFPQAALIESAENLGFVGGNNRAYAAADPCARYILLLNPDAILHPGALATLTAWMDAHPAVGACGPTLLNGDGTLQPSWSRFPTVLSEMRGRQDRRFHGTRRAPELTRAAIHALPEAQPTDWVGGACLLVRREAIESALGGVLLDPAFQMYSEETDLCYRLRRAGWPFYFVPQAEVTHHHGQSSKQASLRTVRLLYDSKYLFFQKHYGGMRTWQLKAGVAVLSMLKWVTLGVLSLLPGSRRAALRAQRERQQAVLQSLRWRGQSS